MKAHLLTSEFPISDGQSQTADCGKEIVKAKIEFCWDSADVGSSIPVSTLMLCSGCAHKAIASVDRRRYIYGITDSAKADG